MIYSHSEYFMDRIDCLRAFVRTLEGGSFSAAAKELGIGQPAISKRIALLEGEFGTQLFLRTTRKLKPTAEAHRIYDLARQIIGSFDMARSSLEETAPRPTGTLRIGVPSSFGRRYMIPVITDYVRNYPEVRVDVRFSERFVNLVEEGIELALRIGNLEASTLVARRLGTVQRHLVATPTYLHGRPTPRTRARDRRDAELTQSFLDGLRHLVGTYGRQPGHHDLGRHQAFRIRQARIAIRDQDLGVLGVVRHLCLLRSPARPIVSLKAVGRSMSPSDTTARLSTKTTSAPRDIARSHATSIAAALSSDRSTS